MQGRRVEISVAEQRLTLYQADEALCSYAVSTARNGTGCEEGSFCTPLGAFRIHRKIGHGSPPGTIFRGREAVGQWTLGEETDDDLILTRILWLDGIDPDNGNTRERYIYIHGTNQEDLIGTPVSHGCVRMRNADIIEFFDEIDEGTCLRIV